MPTSPPVMDPSRPDRPDWRWLEDTYWYVLPENLAALQYDAVKNRLSWVVDQTVWHVTGYRDGYFWGVAAVLVHEVGDAAPNHGRGARPVGFAMLGSVTPEGRVQLTFVPGAALSSRSATVGLGDLVPHAGGFSFEMAMSSGNMDRTAHWAYMAQTSPDEPSWASLPGVGISVPEMLDGIEPPRFAVRDPGF